MTLKPKPDKILVADYYLGKALRGFTEEKSMHEHVGFTKEQWQTFIAQGLEDPPAPGTKEWRKIVNATVRRYKAHAVATLHDPGERYIKLGNGIIESPDKDFIFAVEAECPVADLFRNDFRVWATEQTDPFDQLRGSTGAVKSECLFDACNRLLIRMMPEDARIDRPVPPRPLTRLKKHPFKSRMHNEVFIEEVRKNYPLAVIPKANLDIGRMLPAYTEADVRRLPERYNDGEEHTPRQRYEDCGELEDAGPVVFHDDDAPPDDL